MPETEYTTQRVSQEYITVNNCGEQYLNNRDYDTVRDNGRVDFGIQFIESGRCRFEDGGVAQTAEAGSLLLHFPGVRQHYSFRQEDATHLMWVHFSGDACSMLESIKSDRTVHVVLSDRKEFTRVFGLMIAAKNVRKPYYKSVCNGYLLALLGLILRSADEQARKEEDHIHDGLDKAIGYINMNFNSAIELETLAAMCYVSRSRFLHLFKDYTGVSPHRFQLQCRIERAAELLIYTSMNISECAAAVGFDDSSYFCRVFKKYTGCTPMFYRKKGDDLFLRNFTK